MAIVETPFEAAVLTAAVSGLTYFAANLSGASSLSDVIIAALAAALTAYSGSQSLVAQASAPAASAAAKQA
jgi:hypothetical protein